jgi:hypothetical protein
VQLNTWQVRQSEEEESRGRNEGNYGNIKEGNLEGRVLRHNQASIYRIADTPYPLVKAGACG